MPLYVLLLLLSAYAEENCNLESSDLKMAKIDYGSFDFALKLYRTLSLPNQNLVVSPFSLTSALSMTLYGARENTSSELSEVLFGTEIPVEKLQSMAQGFNTLIEKAVKSNDKVLSTANFMYSHLQYPIIPDFQQTLEKYYSAKSRVLDFVGGAPDAIKAINEDISKATNGKITDLIDSIDPMTRLILANAVYFKGLWKSQFNVSNTQKDMFKLSNDETVEIDMMFQNAKFPYGYSEQLKCKAIELGYENSNVVMVLLLPDEDSSVEALESKLTVPLINSVMKEMSLIKVQVFLPKFKLESSLSLVPSLKHLGIKNIFNVNDANFSGITTDSMGLYVGDVIQKAIIEVNEEGTEAAAATAIMFLSRSLSIPEEFKANRPFMFILLSKYEDEKNLPLFMGALKNPKK